MTASERAMQVARGIRRLHGLTVSLAAQSGNTGDLKEACDQLEQAIATALDQFQVPDGWALVPKEPTHEMRDALWRAMFEEPPGEAGPVLIGAGYDAMLAAAPKPEER